MITQEQVTELREGDVVEMSDEAWQGSIIRGPLVDRPGGALTLGVTDRSVDWEGSNYGWYVVRRRDGSPSRWAAHRSLTVVSRAPHPFYANHPRTEPVAGDIARDVDGDAWRRGDGAWLLTGCDWWLREVRKDYQPLTLLWDGETGKAVS